MRIAIDARELAGKRTGVGRYLAEILNAWGQLAAAASHEFVLCAPEPVDISVAGTLNVRTLISPGGGTLWEQLVLPRLVRQAAADVLFAPGYTAPLRGSTPFVLTVHDVSFAAHPEWFSRREGFRRRLLTRLSARRAARVITVSDFSKREIVRHLGIDHARVDVVYSGSSAGSSRRAPETTGAPGCGAMVLYVGSIFNRRHVPELIHGFARLARRHAMARLELVGDNRTSPHEDIAGIIARTGLGDRITARAYVSDEELDELYARATAFAFLSQYEGFGLTPLEALAARVPVVVLDTAVAREIYGPAAIYVERPDPALVGAALERVLFDADERHRLLEAAGTVLARYSWQECAHRTLQILLANGRQ